MNHLALVLTGACFCHLCLPLRAEFQFINPNSKGSCGCGESFTT
jgi:Fe-S cluster assembly iron-binding protein IscA